jgi:hypothetical protein
VNPGGLQRAILCQEIAMLRTVTVTRYLTPLREGGSLPAIVEADDDGLYVLKFRGAGQGTKALVAELVAGEIGRTLGLRVPELVLARLDPALGRSEPDYEVRSLIQASGGINLGMDYLPGAVAYDPAIRGQLVDRALASALVWFDAFVTNVDRTARNTNLLVWHKQLWPIDHGAALYVHHSWSDYLAHSRHPFTATKDHVLLPLADADGLARADAAAHAVLSAELFARVVEAVPDDWLAGEARFATLAEHRAAYVAYLSSRLEASAIFVEEAQHAGAQLV